MGGVGGGVEHGAAPAAWGLATAKRSGGSSRQPWGVVEFKNMGAVPQSVRSGDAKR